YLPKYRPSTFSTSLARSSSLVVTMSHSLERYAQCRLPECLGPRQVASVAPCLERLDVASVVLDLMDHARHVVGAAVHRARSLDQHEPVGTENAPVGV